MLGLLFCSSAAWADVTLPKIIDSHMVLQRQTKAPIWGIADPGEKVSVNFAGQSKNTVTGAEGRWEVQLDPMEANNDAQEMLIKGHNEIRLTDVLVGEVWLASGQSNMEWQLRQVARDELTASEEQIASSKVRAFHVTSHITSLVPLFDTVGQWKLPAELAAKKEISAVAYFFADELQRKLNIPVAFLDANWGGRPIENFISDEGADLAGIPSTKAKQEIVDRQIKQMKEGLEQLQKAIDLAEHGVNLPVDAQKIGWGNAPNGIYNAMIAPLVPYAIQGAIWYQGESNRGRKDYFEKLNALSLGWSKAFRVKDIPLYLVQIAPYHYDRSPSGRSNTLLCDTIWTAQYKGAEEIPGMAVVPIHDTRIPLDNIHPSYKKAVGERLASMALNRVYKKGGVATAPSVESALLKNGKVVVSINNVLGELKTTDGKAPSWFELSADGKEFVSATASLKGSVVEITVPEKLTPKLVRMGWCEVAIPNLQDSKTGWPVLAFPAQEIK